MLDFIRDISFANKEMLWLLLLLPLLTIWYFFRHNKLQESLRVSTLKSFVGLPSTLKERARHSLFLFRLLSLAMLIIVLARPQSSTSWKDIKTEGIDIIMAIDVSTSMLAKDFMPNRLEAAKEVAIEFIDGRPNDRIGLVVFSGESFTQCPLTSDHKVIKNLFSGVKTGMITDGTAIGSGLATAVSRIKDSRSKSKVVILITDGVNNSGAIAPLTAAEIAKTFGVRVYTVGVGSTGMALSPVGMYPDGSFAYDYAEVKIDEKTMEEIAEMTGGKYFRATHNDKLKDIYHEIDRLEKTIFEEKHYVNKAEMFLPFAVIAGILLLLEFIFKNTVYRSIP